RLAVRRLGAEQLDRDDALELEVLGLVDLAHPALPDRREEAVVQDLATRRSARGCHRPRYYRRASALLAEVGRVEVVALHPALDLHARLAHRPRHRGHVAAVLAQQRDELLAAIGDGLEG